MDQDTSTLIKPNQILEKINISEGMRVADFGSGRTGYFLFPLAKVIGEQGIVYAIDIVKTTLESLKRRSDFEGLDNIQTVWSDIERVGKTPIPDNSLDIAFFVNVLFQLKNRVEALEEAKRLLKKNGLLVIIDWTKNLGPLGPRDNEIVKEEDIQKWTQELNLEFVKKETLSEYTYLMILKKVE